MKFLKIAEEGFLNLINSKMRSVLALLGILVGTASVVAMVSGGQLATNEALKQFKLLGTDLLAVTISDVPDENEVRKTEAHLSLDQAKQFTAIHSDILDVAPYTQLFSPIQYNGEALNGNIVGVTDRFAHIVRVNLLKGRFISILDRYAQFCVIGHNIDERIQKMTLSDSIGQQLQLGKNIFTIVGVLKPWPENAFVYASIDNAVLIPILTSTALSKYSNINNVILRLRPNANIEQIQQDLTRYIHKNVSQKRLFFRSAKELVARMGKQSQIFTIFLGLIGSISLLVGGIGVMNIMLVCVVERRKEIGIRMAVGAKRSDIRLLFLMEAIMLSLVGGLVGVILGMSIAYGMALFWHWEYIFFILPSLIGFSVSVLTGVFFGFYPAYQASQLDPIKALHSD